MNIDKEELKTILKEVSKDFQRQNKVFYEKFEYNIKVIGNGWKVIKEKVDATYNEVGKIKVQLTELEMKIIKMEKDIELIKSDIQFIKADMKKYIRQEEFSALEKRVLILENKYKRI